MYNTTPNQEHQPPPSASTKLESGTVSAVERSRATRWGLTLIVSAMAGIVSFSSSVQTPAVSSIAKDFGISHTLATFAASSAYLLGFGIGPFLLSPLSEILGRRKVYLGVFLIFSLAQLACALLPRVIALSVFRFIAGFTGGPVVANAGGSITDLWPNKSERSAPFAVYTVSCYCGPVLGPILGSVVIEYASWHWAFWLVLIASSVIYIVMCLCLPETYAVRRKPVRHSEKDDIEAPECISFVNELSRPWRMLATEPILLALSSFMAFIYGVLFLDFSAYPIVFIQQRGWSTAQAGLAFLGIGFGMLIATALAPLLDRQYTQLLARSSGPLAPEVRLRHLIFIAWLLPPSLFWFAWSALPPTPSIVPILSGIPFGLALVLLFLGINTYLTDCYARYSASALAANTMLRSLFGAAFALFATNLYGKLGTAWATSLLGFVALALAPIPLLLWQFGPWLRERSRFHLSAIAD